MTLALHVAERERGVGPVRLGMSRQELDAALGAPDRVFRQAYDGVEWDELYYPNWLNVAATAGKVSRIGVSRQARGVTFEGVDVFAADPFEVLAQVERAAGGAHDAGGCILFLPFGLSMTGFHDGYLDEKSLAIEQPDGWRAIEAELKPITFLGGEP